jgi:hypothetical protein
MVPSLVSILGARLGGRTTGGLTHPLLDGMMHEDSHHCGHSRRESFLPAVGTTALFLRLVLLALLGVVLLAFAAKRLLDPHWGGGE